MTTSKPLYLALDEARGVSESNEETRALARAAIDWMCWRLSDPTVQAALTDGCARIYGPDIDGEVTYHEPGWEAVMAAVTAP